MLCDRRTASRNWCRCLLGRRACSTWSRRRKVKTVQAVLIFSALCILYEANAPCRYQFFRYLRSYFIISNSNMGCFCRQGYLPEFFCYEEDHVCMKDNDGRDVHVLVASSGSHLPGLVTVVNSVRKNTHATVIFHLITDSKSRVHLEQWLEMSELRDVKRNVVIFNESWVKDMVGVRGLRKELGSPLNFARYYPQLLIPNYEGRLIYIDDDCLVLGDIQELFNTRIAPGHLAAFDSNCNKDVVERFKVYPTPYVNYLNYSHPTIWMLGIPRDTCGFNAGVYVANVCAWVNAHVTNQLEYWTRLNQKELLYGLDPASGVTQPPMLLVFHNRYSAIDSLWHVRHLGGRQGLHYDEDYLQRARLLHWNGNYKPWHKPLENVNPIAIKMWEKYYVPDPTGKYTLSR